MADAAPSKALARFCAASPIPYGGTIGPAARGTGAVRQITAIATDDTALAFVYVTVGSERWMVRMRDDGKNDGPTRIASTNDAIPPDSGAKPHDCPAPTPAARPSP